eukprot:TRINITY_DN5962_c0_g1_i5.p1 TRINITY_DN5962_c0_g1~~TRINITY_DN5962_c0_g1_i5.p1  ORF type:complete len:571 (+),score=123.60 TRINITY_DN5962_c0_g1_i5:643-2355(+)
MDPTKIVVIQPGSSYLRIGLASDLGPMYIPNIIAWKKKGKHPHPIGDNTATQSESTEFIANRMEGINEIKDSLEFFKQGVQQPPTKGKKGMNAEEDYDVMTVQPVTVPADPRTDAREWTDVSHNQPVLVGEEVLKLDEKSQKMYEIYRPFRHGYINHVAGRSLRVTCFDIQTIWEYGLTKKLGPVPRKIDDDDDSFFRPNFRGAVVSNKPQPPRDLSGYFAVLVIPDLFKKEDVKELISILLRDMRFRAAFVHLESVCATFGAGLTTALVVDIGDTKTSISCVEEGISLPLTRIHMNYGGEQIGKFLLWLLNREDAKYATEPESIVNKFPFTHSACSPSTYLSDERLLISLRENLCHLNFTDTRPKNYSFKVQYNKGDSCQLHSMQASDALLFAPMSLLHPRVYFPLETTTVKLVDEEDYLEELIAGEIAKAKMTDPETTKQPETPDSRTPIPLDAAILKSVAAVERVELRRRLVSSIILTGGVSLTLGLINILEERLINTLPVDQDSIEKVEVLLPPTRKDIDPRFLGWRGGSVAASLESAREMWILRQEWVEGPALSILKERLPFHWW